MPLHQLARSPQILRNRHLWAEARVGYGEASATIARVAGVMGAGLLVAGAHQQVALRRRGLGAAAEKRVDGANCPVLAVRVTGNTGSA
jgi:nucleotide-binding universal stress UspA family protein